MRPFNSIFVIKHIFHIVIGALYPQLFTWTIYGIIASLLVSSALQGLDAIRWYFAYKKWFLEEEKIPENKGKYDRPDLLLKSLILFLYSTIWYSLLTMVAAMLAR